MEGEVEERKALPKALLLYSHNSGKGGFIRHLDEVRDTLSSIFDLEIKESASQEEGTSLILDSCGKYDVLALFGGDGTLQNAISCLYDKPSAPTLAYLGGGTLNDGGKNFGVKKLKDGINNVLRGYVGEYDVVEAGGSSFFYLGGFGAYMDVSYIAKRKMKKAFGHFTYYLLCIKEMFHIHRHPVKIIQNGEVVYDGKAASLSVLNGEWLGGMRVNAKGKLNDGEVEILIVKPTLFNGFIRYILHKGFTRLKGESFRIEIGEDEEWCFDGERGPKGSLDIKVRKGCLKAYCDPKLLK